MAIDREETAKRAVIHFGPLLQKVVAMEEMSELIKEISKDIRGECNREHIVEEMADVVIMIHQLLLMYGITDEEFDEEIERKLVRLARRIDSSRIRKPKHAKEEFV